MKIGWNFTAIVKFLYKIDFKNNINIKGYNIITFNNMNLIKPFRINSLKTMIPFLQKRYIPMASQLTVPMAVPMALPLTVPMAVPMSPMAIPMAIPMTVPMSALLTGDLFANESLYQYEPSCFTCKHFIKTYDKMFDTVYSGKCSLYYDIDNDKQIKYKKNSSIALSIS